MDESGTIAPPLVSRRMMPGFSRWNSNSGGRENGAMDKEKLLARLLQIDVKIEAAIKRIEAQRRLMARIPLDREDRVVAHTLLRNMEHALETYRAIRAAIDHALNGDPATSPKRPADCRTTRDHQARKTPLRPGTFLTVQARCSDGRPRLRARIRATRRQPPRNHAWSISGRHRKNAATESGVSS